MLSFTTSFESELRWPSGNTLWMKLPTKMPTSASAKVSKDMAIGVIDTLAAYCSSCSFIAAPSRRCLSAEVRGGTSPHSRYASSAAVVAASITGLSPISCNCSRSK